MTNVVNKVRDTLVKNEGWDKLGIGPSNTLRQVADPSSIARNKIGTSDSGGAPVTASTLIDPGRWLSKSPLDPAKSNAEAAAAIDSAPKSPNQDTAANSAQQQSDYLRRRRGILGNIFGGNQPNSTPVVSQKQLLGQ